MYMDTYRWSHAFIRKVWGPLVLHVFMPVYFGTPLFTEVSQVIYYMY